MSAIDVAVSQIAQSVVLVGTKTVWNARFLHCHVLRLFHVHLQYPEFSISVLRCIHFAFPKGFVLSLEGMCYV